MTRFLSQFGLLALLVMPVAGGVEAQTTAAEDPAGAEEFIAELADDAFAILNDINLTGAERDQAFRDLLAEGFALDYVSRLVLGRHGRTATREQLREYEEVFPEYILRIYSSRLTEYGDEEVIVDGTAPAGKRDLYVRSRITRPDGPPLAADWRVRKMDGAFKVIDLKVEGISMVISQRDEFMSKIASSGLDSLIADLRQHANMDSNPGVRAAVD